MSGGGLNSFLRSQFYSSAQHTLGMARGAVFSARNTRMCAPFRSFSVEKQSKDAAADSRVAPINPPTLDNTVAKSATSSASVNTSTTAKVEDANADRVKQKKTAEEATEKLERAKNRALYEQWASGPTAYYYRELETKAVKQGWAGVLRASIEQYLKMVRENTLSESASTAPTVFIRLQNPLLAKYKFDVLDFTAGSEMALRSIRAALCSQSLYNYANNIGETDPVIGTASATASAAGTGNGEKAKVNAVNINEAAKSSTTAESAPATSAAKMAAGGAAVDASSADFLKEVLYPSLYHQCVDALREMKSKGIGFTKLPLGVEMHAASIIDIDVRMVTKEEHADVHEDNALFVKCAAEEEEMLVKHQEMLMEYEKMVKAVAANGGVGADTVPESLHQEMLQKLQADSAVPASKDAAGADADAVADDKGGMGQGLHVPSLFNRHFSNSKGEILQLPLFPVGSVVVDVKVRFEFTPIASASQQPSSREKRESPEWAEFARGMPTVMEWILSGCISGHAPLEYRVTSFQAGSDWY